MRLALALALGLLVAGCGAQEAREPPPPLPKEWDEPEPSRALAARHKVWERCRPAASLELRLCDRGASTIDPCQPGELEDYDPCGEMYDWTRATIELKDGDEWRVVARHAPGDIWKDMVVGHWRDAWLSPDGRTILGQWSGECEVPIAFFIPAPGGPMRPVTGERDWTESVMSVAHGWSGDGRAHVSLLGPSCGNGHPEPGRYLIDPRTHELERVGPLAAAYAG